jgi:hypothetical protein
VTILHESCTVELPSFGIDQLREVVKSDQRAVDRILSDYYAEITKAAGHPDGPAPNYVEIAKLIAIFEDPASRSEMVQIVRRQFPWLARDFDRDAWKAQQAVIAAAEQEFFRAIGTLDGDGLESFTISLLDEYRADKPVGTLAQRMCSICRALKLPEPIDDLSKMLATLARALEVETGW